MNSFERACEIHAAAAGIINQLVSGAAGIINQLVSGAASTVNNQTNILNAIAECLPLHTMALDPESTRLAYAIEAEKAHNAFARRHAMSTNDARLLLKIGMQAIVHLSKEQRGAS